MHKEWDYVGVSCVRHGKHWRIRCIYLCKRETGHVHRVRMNFLRNCFRCEALFQRNTTLRWRPTLEEDELLIAIVKAQLFVLLFREES